jgi:hypothetical protein
MGVNDNGFIRGLVGPLVNRKVGDKNYVQSRPKPVKQKEDTKKAGREFGTVSRAGALIRTYLSEIHQQLHDGQMGNRLNRQIYRAIKTNLDREKGSRTLSNCVLDRLVNFQFNEICPTQDYLFIDPAISLSKKKKLKVSFPEFDMKRATILPKRCNAIVFKFQAFAFNFDQLRSVVIQDTEWEYDVKYKENIIPEKSLSIACGDFVGSSIFVGFTILYLAKDRRRPNILNEKDFNPASILTAFQLE